MFLHKGLKRTLEQRSTEDTQCIWYLVFIWSDLLTDTPDSRMLLTLSLWLPSFLLCFSCFPLLLYFSVRRCSQLFAPDNGYMNCDSDGDNYGATCSFKCTGGHELSGSAARVCQYGLTWSGTETKCSRKSVFFLFHFALSASMTVLLNRLYFKDVIRNNFRTTKWWKCYFKIILQLYKCIWRNVIFTLNDNKYNYPLTLHLDRSDISQWHQVKPSKYCNVAFSCMLVKDIAKTNLILLLFSTNR